MLPSDMDLNVRLGTVGYKNEILVSDGLGKNQNFNIFELAKICHKVVQQPTITHKNQKLANTQAINHKEERIVLIISMAGGYMIWNMLQ